MNGYAPEMTSAAQHSANAQLAQRLCSPHSRCASVENAATATATVSTARSAIPIAAASG
jgi:hypothetical protein